MAKVPIVMAEDTEMIPDDGPQTKTAVEPKKWSNPFKASTTLMWVTVAIIIGLTVAIVLVIRDRSQLQDKVNDLSSSSERGKDETEKLVSELSKYLELPTGETPTLATVTDVDSLKDQQFFKSAQNGDKVLLFAKAGKAVLYRPSTQKVVDISSIATEAADTTKTSN